MAEKYLVVGAGITGRSAMDFLKKQSIAFDVYDTRQDIPDLALLKQNYPISQFYAASLSTIDWRQYSAVVLSPGINPRHEVVQSAQHFKIPLKGDLQLFAETVTKPVIAITGTNGKSTVTALVGHLLQQVGIKAQIAGNIGVPMLMPNQSDIDVWVLELSSFQLWYQQTFAPDVACILNFSEDHLDWHSDMIEYQQAKHRIFARAKKKIYNADCPMTYPDNQDNSLSFGLEQQNQPDFTFQNGAFLYRGKTLFDDANLPLAGSHNYQNILSALAIIEAYGQSLDHMQTNLSTFEGLAHRSQLIKERQQVKWINDSKGTNVGATLAAIQGIGSMLTADHKIVWIAGGVGKGADFSPLSQPVAEHVKCAILLGEDKHKIASVLPPAVPFFFVDSLKEAVVMADKYAQPHDSVLFSPACASFDMFDNYVHRGECFGQLVQEL